MSDLEGLFHQKVEIEFFSGRNDYGDIIYQAPRTYTCRVSGEEKIIRDNEGREFISKVRVTVLGNIPPKIGTNPGLDSRSRVTLPAGCIPRQPPIISVGRYPDAAGSIHHTTLYF